MPASCPQNGLVLNSYGQGATAVLAKQNGRNYAGFDLNPAYCQVTEQRLAVSYHAELKFSFDDMSEEYGNENWFTLLDLSRHIHQKIASVLVATFPLAYPGNSGTLLLCVPSKSSTRLSATGSNRPEQA